MIRRTIIDIFQEQGSPVPLEGIALRIGTTEQEVRDYLDQQEKLDDLCGLTLDGAFTLIEFYGPKVIFTDVIAQNVTDAVLTRRRLDRIERRKRGGGDSPPGSQEGG